MGGRRSRTPSRKSMGDTHLLILSSGAAQLTIMIQRATCLLASHGLYWNEDSTWAMGLGQYLMNKGAPSSETFDHETVPLDPKWTHHALTVEHEDVPTCSCDSVFSTRQLGSVLEHAGSSTQAVLVAFDKGRKHSQLSHASVPHTFSTISCACCFGGACRIRLLDMGSSSQTEV